MMFTAKDYFQKYACFTFRELRKFVGGEDALWEAYFLGGMDEELRILMEGAMGTLGCVQALRWHTRHVMMKFLNLFGEIPVEIDPSLPPGTIEFRSRDQVVRIENVAVASGSAPPPAGPSTKE